MAFDIEKFMNTNFENREITESEMEFIGKILCGDKPNAAEAFLQTFQMQAYTYEKPSRVVMIYLAAAIERLLAGTDGNKAFGLTKSGKRGRKGKKTETFKQQTRNLIIMSRVDYYLQLDTSENPSEDAAFKNAAEELYPSATTTGRQEKIGWQQIKKIWRNHRK